MDPQEHSLFLKALKQLGFSSNMKLAEIIDSKNAKQINMHKHIFLRNNPNWLSEAQATIQTPATILVYTDDLCIFEENY